MSIGAPTMMTVAGHTLFCFATNMLECAAQGNNAYAILPCDPHAGVKLSTYESALPKGTRVIRVMPNTPLLVGAGATAYCLGAHATASDESRIATLLGASGLVVKVPEHLMDAVSHIRHMSGVRQDN